MEPSKIVLMRFDYVLSGKTEETLDNLADWFGDQPNSTMGSIGPRGNERIDQTYQLDDPSDLGLSDFEYYAVRVVQATNAVTEIISVAPVKEQRVTDIIDNHSRGSRIPHYESWGRQMGHIRSKIPGDTTDVETSMIWVQPDTIPSDLRGQDFGISDVEHTFRDGEASRFISDFRTSVSRGMVHFNDGNIIFSKEIQQMFGDIVAIDVGQNINAVTEQFGHKLAGSFPDLSALYSIHYWCVQRGKRLDSLEDEIDRSRHDFPAPDATSEEIFDQFELDTSIYSVQQEWGSLYSSIKSEHAELANIIQSEDIEFEDSAYRGARGEGVFEAYHSGVSNEHERIHNDLERIDKSLDSISMYMDQQLSILSAKESIQLQQDMNSHTKSANSLQETIESLTWLVAILTLILVLDATMSGGISSLIDTIQSNGTSGVSSQSWAGIGLGLVILLSYFALKRLDIV